MVDLKKMKFVCRLEHTSSGHNKFYEIYRNLNDSGYTELWTRWGRIFTDGQIKHRYTGPTVTVDHEIIKLKQSKLDKGYKEIETNSRQPKKKEESRQTILSSSRFCGILDEL
jgi:predicted DNA-binding WGR domain protein